MAARNGDGVRVTIRCSGSDVSACLRPDVPVGELMPELLRLAVPPDGPPPEESPGWAAGPAGGSPFTPWNSLAESGVGDGAVIVVERYDRWPQSGLALVPTGDLLPHQRSLAVLPA